MSDRLKTVIINLVLGGGIAALAISLTATEDMTLWHKLHNGFFVAGVLLAGLGGLRAVAKTGSFDAMGYSLKTTLHTFLPMLSSGEKEDFLTYKEEKAQNRKSAAELLIAGGVYLALSLVALGLYYVV